MIFCTVVTLMFLLIGVWNLTFAILGRFPRFCATAVGTLKSKYIRRNIRYRSHKLPNETHYTYAYRVGERKYLYRGVKSNSKRGLYEKVPLVYVKGFPRRVYPYRFKGTLEWTLGLSGLFMAALFGTVILLAETGVIPK